MVERNGFPVTLPVARFAFPSIGPFVLVVFLVTGETLHQGIFKCRSEVTLLALCRGMLSHQRETRFIVVERSLLPGSIIVTF